MTARRRLSTFFAPSRSKSADAPRVPLPSSEQLTPPQEPSPPRPATSKLPRTKVGTRKLSKDDRRALRLSVDNARPYQQPLVSVTADGLTRSGGSSLEKVPDEPLLPPPVFGDGGAPLASPSISSQPNTPVIGSRPATPKSGFLRHSTLAMSDTKLNKRKSWFHGGSSSKNKSKSEISNEPSAWIIGPKHGSKVTYNLAPLLRGEKVQELWFPEGDTLVYLFPQIACRGPQFRVDSANFASSQAFTRMLHGKVYSTSGLREQRSQNFSERRNHQFNLEVNGAQQFTPESSLPSRNTSNGSSGSWPIPDSMENLHHLYLPLKLSADYSASPSQGLGPGLTGSDIESLVSIRNLISFLHGQSLVATDKQPSIFNIFTHIAELLKSYEFSNLDGSTFGEVANTSFDCYVDELEIGDVRSGRGKTIDAIVLGELMRSVKLYNEGFVHGVGKYDDINLLGSPRFTLISPTTQNRMERAHMDLKIRLLNIDQKLTDFDFPSIFAGPMDSKSAIERKTIKFDQWKLSFLATRKHVLSHYKSTYGSWPPKASSKKNDLETNGLNRLVLKNIYRDFTQLYDMLVDRESLTTRSVDAVSVVQDDNENQPPLHRALRRVLSEFDHSTPPVLPPVPFDVPLLPTLATTNPAYGQGDHKKDAKLRGRKIKNDEINKILQGSYNRDSLHTNPFLLSFFELERRCAHNKTIEEIVNNRVGQWIFMYSVLQTLPMLVIDAPDIKWSEGVEYFLCEVPRSGVPWAREASVGPGGGRNWYNIAGGQGVVNLPTDIVEHGVEGIYRRSHCWNMAQKWTEGNAVMAAAIAPENQHVGSNPLPAPPTFHGGYDGTIEQRPSRYPSSAPGSRTVSRSGSPARQSVMMLGLDKLPMGDGASPVRAPHRRRPQSSGDPTKTFDSILGPAPPMPTTKAERRRTRKMTNGSS